MRRNTRQTPAFTLVELLVVIGIIALLIAILLPALQKAKQQALKLACAANLRSQGQGLAVYINDTKYYPGHAGIASNGRPVAVWPSRLRKFAKATRGIFGCPANEEGFRWRDVTGPPGGIYATDADARLGYDKGELLLDVDRVPFSYGYNDWGTDNCGSYANPSRPQKGLGADTWDKRCPELRASKVRKPSEMFAIMDNICNGSWDYNVDPTNDKEWPGKLHNRGANVLFCDGHVGWYLQKDLVNINKSSPGGYAMNSMWNNDNKPYP